MLCGVLLTHGDQIRSWSPCLGYVLQPLFTFVIPFSHQLSLLSVFLLSEAGISGDDYSVNSLSNVSLLGINEMTLFF